jgi:exopolysaccharide biosynthesis polyprenyl glycosylphosphotransferase
LNKRIEKFLVIVIDFITINLALIMFFALRSQIEWKIIIVLLEFIFPALAIYLYWLIIFTFVGLYRSWFASSRFDEISTLFKASFFGIFILFLIIFIDDYVHNVSSTSRFLIFIYWGFFLVFVSIGRLAVRSIQRNLLIKGVGRKNALIVGFNPTAIEFYEQINSHRALGLDIVGFVAVKEENVGKSRNEVKVVGNIKNLTDIIDKYNAKEVILAVEKHQEDLLIELISKCENKNVGLKVVPDLYEILSGQARTAQIYGFPLIDVNPQLMPEWEKSLKRLLDVCIAFLILLLTLPLIIITAIVIKLDSKGPVFFKQIRCGINGKTFKVLKFRSMCHDAEKHTGPIWSHKGDTRVTKVGKVIRKIRLDELPQMLNILKGEMSLVGPRPERPYFVEKLAEEIPYYKRRLKVRPGVTGWAQVKHKYDESLEDVKAKLKYDLFYIENMSLKMDFKILFRTIFVVLFGKGHYD